MPLETPRDLFVHELSDIHSAEQLIARMLKEAQGMASNPQLKQALQQHEQQTQQHARNLEQVFQQLGEEPKAEECVGFEGLKSEYQQIKGETSPELADLVGVAGVARTEHYEIAAYENLITMARALGEREAVDLLEQNLKDDKETLRQIESIAKELSKEQAKETTEA